MGCRKTARTSPPLAGTTRRSYSNIRHRKVGTVNPSDHSKGFGGKYGVQEDSQDKSALGWDHKEKLQQHPSQKGRYC